jgi:hypothetical protein
MPKPATREEHFEFRCRMVGLQLWFVRHWLSRHTDETFAAVLHERTDVFRYTDLYDGRPLREIDWEEPRWSALEDRIQRLYLETRDTGEPGDRRFETQGLAILLDRVRARAEADWQRGPNAVLARSQCGSLRYDPPKPDHPTRVPFHIANGLRPRSMLDDPDYLPQCLECLMEKAGREHGADSMSTVTWLNSHPKWLAFFPPEWRAGRGPEMRLVGTGLGFWGQFVSARGTFNAHRARRFRATGELPYWPRAAWCTFEALRAHLAALRGDPGARR